MAAVFGIALSGCDFIDGLLGKSGNDNPEIAVPADPLAEGGKTVVDGDWEIHVFTESAALAFLTPPGDSIEADCFIVAGGGGSGGGDILARASIIDTAGGGGAGGLLYKTGVTLPLADGTVDVIVGEGGAGASARGVQGVSGGNSSIGKNENKIEVSGGGGGGGGGDTSAKSTGLPGGSGGGGGAGNSVNGSGGTGKSDEGYKGGTSNASYGGGGGGANGAGKDGSEGSAGGVPWDAAEAGALWISNATGIAEFSRGGNGGTKKSEAGGTAGVNYGDGGSASNNVEPTGAAGHSGIVVIRFRQSSVLQLQE